jgi:hypothetical protein
MELLNGEMDEEIEKANSSSSERESDGQNDALLQQDV